MAEFIDHAVWDDAVLRAVTATTLGGVLTVMGPLRARYELEIADLRHEVKLLREICRANDWPEFAQPETPGERHHRELHDGTLNEMPPETRHA